MSQQGGRASRIGRNTLSNSVGRLVTLATTFVMTPFILHHLGETAFGLWILANAVVSYGTLLDFGMGSAIIKYVADARARGEKSTAHELLGTATRIYAGLAVLALGVGAVLATQADRVIHLGPAASAVAPAVLALVTVSFGINLAATPASAALRGLQRYDLTNAITVVNALATAALTVFVLLQGWGLVAMVAVNVPVALGSQLVTVLMLRRLNPMFALRWSPTSRGSARNLTGFGVTLTVSQLAVLLQKRTSEIIITAAMSVSAVAPYSLARRLSELPHMMSDQFIKVLLPVASELHATGEPEGLRRLYLVSTRITLALMFPLALCAGFLAGDLLELWVGAKYRDQGVLVVVLVIASVAFTSQWPAGSVFQGIGRFGWFAVASLVSGVLNVALTVFLIKPYGLMGVAVGTLVPTVLEALACVLPYTLWKLGIPVGAVVRQVLIPTVLPVAPCVGVLLLAARLVDQPSWPALILTGLAGGAAYAVAYLFIPAAAAERALAARTLRRLVRR
ncbi:lipopolysaccharide biosynthesis protein [Pengzhenrongella sp.]|uniref:lipopolysaccharide biosynthesis protein n=1 Tax=Pengzhenrongella sp. TaxID=2888820 RepID=UPI002F93E687